MFQSIINHKFEKTTKLSIISLIFTIGIAGFNSVWSVYLKSFGVTDSNVGFIAGGFVLISLIFSFYSTIILEKFSNVKIIIYSLIILTLSLIGVSFVSTLSLFLLIWIIVTCSKILNDEAFGILFVDKSNNKDLEKNEGLKFTLANVGWFFGPLIIGLVLLKFSERYVFAVTGIIILISLFSFLKLNIKSKFKKRIKIDSDILKNLKDYFTDMNLVIPYIMACGVKIWWGLVFIFVPLLIIKNGYSISVVGFFVSAVIIPLILFEYKIGKIAISFGFKKLFFIGFLILSILCVVMFYLDNFLMILALLVLANAPVALIEPIQNSYFFRQVKKIDEEKYFPIFSTSTATGSLIAHFSIAIVLLFFSDKYIFLLMAVFMGIMCIISLKVKDYKSDF